MTQQTIGPLPLGSPSAGCMLSSLNRRIVSWDEDNGMRAPCQAGFRPGMSTEHQLFALRHFLDRSKSRKCPPVAAFVDLKNAYANVQHHLLWASLQLKGIMATCLQPFSRCIVEAP